MYRLVMVVVLAGGMWFLYTKKAAPPPPPPPPEPPPVLEKAPPQVLQAEELGKIRLATKDAESNVRWAAIKLLHDVRDPGAYSILQETMMIDTDPTVRRSALNLLKGIDRPERAKDIAKTLRDTEKDIRMAALMALGEVGDPESAQAIVKILHDTEPEVRTLALQTLGNLQRKQDEEHRAMQEEVRQAYEAAVVEYEQKYQGRRPAIKQKDLADKMPE